MQYLSLKTRTAFIITLQNCIMILSLITQISKMNFQNSEILQHSKVTSWASKHLPTKRSSNIYKRNATFTLRQHTTSDKINLVFQENQKRFKYL